MAAFERMVTSLADVPLIRRVARRLAADQGLPPLAVEAVAIAVSELGTNLVFHAGEGTILVDVATRAAAGRGIRVESRDAGPGIADVAQAMQDGFSTRGGLGNGLPAVCRLMDEVRIATGPGGTTIVAYKWAPTS